MRLVPTEIQDLVEIFPSVFHDERGFFYESYSEQKLELLGFKYNFIQDNTSFSKKGVIRGMHIQHEPFGQGKLVKVVSGKVKDVVVDVRLDSPTFGQAKSFILDDQIGNMVFVPSGFLHGFIALEDTFLSYKCTKYYDKASESGVLWNDATLQIDWQMMHSEVIVSEKDTQLLDFQSFIKQLEKRNK